MHTFCQLQVLKSFKTILTLFRTVFRIGNILGQVKNQSVLNSLNSVTICIVGILAGLGQCGHVKYFDLNSIRDARQNIYAAIHHKSTLVGWSSQESKKLNKLQIFCSILLNIIKQKCYYSSRSLPAAQQAIHWSVCSRLKQSPTYNTLFKKHKIMSSTIFSARKYNIGK